MRKRNSKLLKTMMLGSLAFMMMLGSFRASAQEIQVFKCASRKGQIVYQDFVCRDDQVMEFINIKFNQSADVAPGLRPQENLMAAQAQQRQMLALCLQS